MSARITEALNCVTHALMVLPLPSDGQGKRAWASLLEAQKLLEALSTKPGAAEGWQPTHRHKKRGSTYRVIAEGRLQVDADLDNEKVVVYRGEDGQVWVRPTYEFNDGRFETLPAAPLPQDTHHWPVGTMRGPFVAVEAKDD